ncbi:MAG: 2-amino-4-hydroxy-6-hydroxymethyldihydropteridine diphosphokinase [Bacillota bacterium]|nr:2-amino-4-hydroxy-6-hydroxymethyldihydropteridine diphosphokinase [Bacillota bacterium]
MRGERRRKVRAFIALGSNLGEREWYLSEARRRLALLPGVRILATSGIYETEPVGPVEQGWFLNQVVAVQTELSPRELLKALLQIEEDLGRQRTVRWGPRTIDLDLLWYGGESIEEEGLTVPHPRLWERAFVLRPLAEVAPDLLAPGGVTLLQYVQQLPTTPVVRRLED